VNQSVAPAMVEALLSVLKPEGVTLPEMSMPFPTPWFEQE